MIIDFSPHDCLELWEGVLYFPLNSFPDVTRWELKCVSDFIAYERSNGRSVQMRDDDGKKLRLVCRLLESGGYENCPPPEKLTFCTACTRRGCLTRYLLHTASLENALLIFDCGELRSAVRARGLPASVLAAEQRNAARDPPDFFDYVMLSWGNCQAGDRLVTERALKRLPTPDDLGPSFIPGVRFYFRYDRLAAYPDAVSDGFLPLKIRDRLPLGELFACISPADYRPLLAPHIPPSLQKRVFYLPREGEDLWQWSEKVYTFIEGL